MRDVFFVLKPGSATEKAEATSDEPPQDALRPNTFQNTLICNVVPLFGEQKNPFNAHPHLVDAIRMLFAANPYISLADTRRTIAMNYQ